MSSAAGSSRVVLITGATGALGKKTAHAFAERGHSLVLLDRNQDRLDALTAELKLPDDRLLATLIDLADRDSIESVAKEVSAKFGGIHGLIHLVGGWVGGQTLTEASAEDFESMLSQHVWTTFHLFQAFIPLLANSGWGRILIVSASTVADPPPKRSIYLAAKAAQENLVLSAASELGESGVTANIIQVHSIDARGEGKGTTPEEIVAAMLYLFSEDSSKVNKARIPLFR